MTGLVEEHVSVQGGGNRTGKSRGMGSISSTFQRGITPRFRVKRLGDRASTMALLARFSIDFSLLVEFSLGMGHLDFFVQPACPHS